MKKGCKNQPCESVTYKIASCKFEKVLRTHQLLHPLWYLSHWRKTSDYFDLSWVSNDHSPFTPPTPTPQFQNKCVIEIYF